MEAVRREAFELNLSQPDVVRSILGLPVSRRAKRPRLTASLSQQDYETLGERYQLDPEDALAIKERVLAELVAFASEEPAKPARKRRATKAKGDGDNQ